MSAWVSSPTVQWTDGRDGRRIVFLVGDAPPHMDYAQDTKYPATLAVARQKDIIVNAVLAGDARDTERVWRDIAQNGNGRFIPIRQDGGHVVVIETPYDDDIIILQKQINGTVIPYGPRDLQERTEDKTHQLSHLAAAAPAQASDMASYLNKRAKVSSEAVTGHGDLVSDVAAGRQAKPGFVLWPENATATDPITDTETNDGIWAAVQAIGVPVVVGGLPNAPDRTHVLNQGIVWDPVTGPGDRYTKHNPVPFGEYLPMRGLIGDRNFGGLSHLSYDMVAGTRQTPLLVDRVPVADAICFDIAFDGVVDPQTRNGGRLLTVQTSNATFIHTDQIDQQFAITRLRAIESGKWTVVASTNGRSGVIDPSGRVVDSADPRTTAVLLDDVDLVAGVSPGVRLGVWVGRGCLLATLVGLATVALAYRRRT